MNAIRKLTAVVGGAATSAAAVGLTIGFAVASAAPAASGATLVVCQDVKNPDNYRISIKGVYPMLEPDAVGYLVHVNDGIRPGGPGPGGMIYHLEADDGNGWPGDRSIANYFAQGNQTDSEGYVRPGSGGIEYLREISVPRKLFNEDDSVFNDEDEIYAVVTFRDGDGGERTAFSQKVVRHFEVAGICDGCCR